MTSTPAFIVTVFTVNPSIFEKTFVIQSLQDLGAAIAYHTDSPLVSNFFLNLNPIDHFRQTRISKLEITLDLGEFIDAHQFINNLEGTIFTKTKAYVRIVSTEFYSP